MLNQNRTKNLVSNYLKGIDNQLRNGPVAKMHGNSRNAVVAPMGTKKTNKSGLGGTMDGRDKARYY